jgi:hypothetical protein
LLILAGVGGTRIGATGFELVVALYLLPYAASVGSTDASNNARDMAGKPTDAT